ncbi:MAG TPA: type II secretion system protein GspG [Planctomycetota bacterium]|nr:type II secretion system protein GspG [Planctomycetota bacterium]
MQQRNLTAHAHSQGFSLIEVLIAVTIIVLMGGVVAFNVFPALFKSQRGRAEADIEVMRQAVKMFQTNEHKLPMESDWPRFLVEGSPNQKQPYIDADKVADGRVLDPWGNDYVYKRLSSTDFEIISYGMDGAPGGEGDDADISSKKSKN